MNERMETNMTNDMQLALNNLRYNVEASISDQDGVTWGEVYLDNAKPKDWSGKKWSGILSNLKKVGVYKEYGDCFGLVLVE
jgi:hypothetical protein